MQVVTEGLNAPQELNQAVLKQFCSSSIASPYQNYHITACGQTSQKLSDLFTSSVWDHCTLHG